VPVPRRGGVLALAQQVGADGEGAVALLARHIGQRGAAQAPARREQRDRLEDIGFARAVFAHQQVELARALQRGGAVVAEPAKADAIENGALLAGLAVPPAAGGAVVKNAKAWDFLPKAGLCRAQRGGISGFPVWHGAATRKASCGAPTHSPRRLTHDQLRSHPSAGLCA
jgi:hypothetical protein